MNLKSCEGPPLPQKSAARHQTLFTMRLILLLTILFCMQSTAKLFAQQITISVKNASIENVLDEIKKQSGYSLIIKDHLLDNAPHITLTLKNVSVQKALDECFKNQLLSYEFVGRTIVVKEGTATIPSTNKKNVQPEIIKGKVVDSTGYPILGVSIHIKNSPLNAITNSNGEFAIQGPLSSVLVFSFIGYQTLQATARDLNLARIVIRSSPSKLDEVKVIGYGTTTQRLSTGSVTKITSADIEKQPVSDPLAALVGRVPGLFITQANGLPGSGFNVLIRGKSSIQQGTVPLYIIDGIPFDSSNPSQLVSTGSINVNNPFEAINPSDIESIEVLKDADATSIYGSRGANGVILITTKRGKAGSLNVGLDTYTGWGKVTRSLKLMDGSDYRALRREAFANDGITPDIGSAPELFALDTNIVNNWQKILIGKTSATTNVQFRLSGGNANTQFTAGANYNYQGTVFPGDNSATRKSFNFSVNHNSTDKKFNALITSSYSYNSSNLIPVDLTTKLNIVPYGFKLKDASGNLVWDDATSYFGNPLSYTLQGYNGYTDFLNTSAVLSYKIVSGLQIKLNGGYNLTDFNENLIAPIASYDPSQNVLGSASFGHSLERNWSIEPQLQYSTILKKKLKASILIGSSWQETSNAQDKLLGSGYTSDALINTISGAAKVTATNNSSLYKYNALFGRVSLNWDDTYLLNITGRRDGSSRFGPGNQFANFGSFGAGWIFSNLSFFKKIDPVLNYGKIRASYGTSGNDQIGNYNYLDSYTPSSKLYQGALSLQPTRLYNANYSWEFLKKLDAAIELGFLNDRIYLSVDYFRNRSTNQLVSYSLPSQTGFNTVVQNFPGTVQNKGWEVELRGDIVRGKGFSWSASANLTVPKNALIAYPGLEQSNDANTFVLGQSLNVFRGFQYLGVDSQTGIYKFLDKNKDGVYDASDYVTLGNFDPKFYGGLQNTIRIQRFALDFLFQFVKQTGRNPVFSSGSFIGGDGNLPDYVSNHWQKPGDNAIYAKATETFGSALADSYTYVAQSGAVLTDASYIRLKNISLSFQIPEQLLKALRLKSLSTYVEAQNLLTITKYVGPDPEVQSLFNLPPLRVIAVGVKATF